MKESLVEYGIHTEKSDIRAHVSVVNRAIYVFRTQCGIDAIGKYHPRLVGAEQPNVEGITAQGWLVRTEWIEDLRRLRFKKWDGWQWFDPKLSTTEKGLLAVDAVRQCLTKGRFPLWITTGLDAPSREVEIEGTDILVCANKRIQVKCDYRCGEKPDGTGNLFLQKAERNPLGHH